MGVKPRMGELELLAHSMCGFFASVSGNASV